MIPAGHAHPFDSTPHLPAAGLGGGKDVETAETTLKPEIYNPPEICPDHIKKWRKETTPGKICLHPGVADDADHERLEVYGRAEPVGVKVHEVLNTAPKSYLIEKNVEKKEGIYLSHKREPLGKPYIRGHDLPGEFASGSIGFGRPTPQDVAGTQSKHLLHPAERLIPEAERQLYVKSHSNFDPGEQRRRGYSWVDKDGPIDPALFRFGGAVKDGEKAGVAKAINPALDPTYKRPPVVVEKLLEDFRVVSTEGLGTVKNLGLASSRRRRGRSSACRRRQGPSGACASALATIRLMSSSLTRTWGGRSVRGGATSARPRASLASLPSAPMSPRPRSSRWLTTRTMATRRALRRCSTLLGLPTAA